MWLVISLVISLFSLYHAQRHVQPNCNYLASGDYFYVATGACIPYGEDYGTYIDYHSSSKYECISSTDAPKNILYQDGICSNDPSTSNLIISKDVSTCKYTSSCSYVNLVYTLADTNHETNKCDRYAYSNIPSVYKYPIITECLTFLPNSTYYYRISCDNNLQFNYNLYHDSKCKKSVSDQIYSIYKNDIDGFFACFQCTSEYVSGDDNNDNDDDDDNDDNDSNDDNSNDNNMVSSTTTVPVFISETLPIGNNVLQAGGTNNNNNNTTSENKSLPIIIVFIILITVAILCGGVIIYKKREQRAMEIVNGVVMSNNGNVLYNEEAEEENNNNNNNNNKDDGDDNNTRKKKKREDLNGETTPIHANTNPLKDDEIVTIY